MNRLLAAGEPVRSRRVLLRRRVGRDGRASPAARDRAGRHVQGRHERARRGVGCSRRRASACGISTADRWTPAGRAGSSSSSSFRSRACSRRELDAGNLNAKYDVLIFVDGAIPAAGARRPRRRRTCQQSRRARRSTATQLGRVTAERTIPQIRRVRRGRRHGRRASATRRRTSPRTSSCRSRITWSRTAQPLPRAKFFVPGSVLTARVDTTHPLACRHARRGPTSSSTTARCSSWAGRDRRRRTERSPGSTRRRRCAAAGRGVRSIWRAASSRSRRGSARARRALRPRDPAARAAARHVQAAVQRDLLSRRRPPVYFDAS